MEILKASPSLAEAGARRIWPSDLSPLNRLYLWRCLIYLATILTLIILMFIEASHAPIAQAQATNEYQVKAAFLYNFAKFIEWAPEAFADERAPLPLCVIGEDPFGSALDQTINGKTVNGHPLLVKRLKWGENLRDCKILFISSSERKRLAPILESVKGAGGLTVSEMDGFARLGGVINFIVKDHKIGFEINVSAAERAPLKVSSKLLALAKVIKDDPQVRRK